VNILIDTNIFIYREDAQVVPVDLSSLLRLLEENAVRVFVHPLSKEDINRDSDTKRKLVSLSKIAAYPELASPPLCNQESGFIRIIGPAINSRERVDNELLYAVYKDAVDFLITSDKEIFRKAQKAGLSDRVFDVQEGLEFFKGHFTRGYLAPTPAIKQVEPYNLDLSDSIFDVLKRDYPGFEGWWRKISREQRKVWVYEVSKGNLGGILILKEEEEPIDSIPPIQKKRRLKICTLIVKHAGQKLGELFLKVAMRDAIEKDIDEIYLTHYARPDDELANLLEQYGFLMCAQKSDGEGIYLKRFNREIPMEELEGIPPAELDKKYYPAFYDGPRIRKHIIPIKPGYHDRLFIEYRERTPTLLEAAGELISEGNTIKKAYICHAKAGKLGEGDVLLFYRSQDQLLTSLCTVGKVFRKVDSYEETIKLVARRTVYLKQEILDLLERRPVTIILLLYHFELKKYLKLVELQEFCILRGAPQSVMEISDESYRKILNLGGLDGRFTLH
jgi:hypothetical protein